MTGDVPGFYKAYLSALNAHEFDRMDEFVHEQLTINGEPVTREQMIAAQRGLVDVVPDFAWQLEDLLVDGARVAARLTVTGTPERVWLGRASDGTSFTATEYGMYELRGDRFTHVRNLVDVDALRRSAGPIPDLVPTRSDR